MSDHCVGASRLPLLLVTRNFPPLWGGMERLNWHMAQELGRRYRVHVVAPTGAGERAPEQVGVTEVALRPLWRFLLGAAFQALIQARRLRPAVVLAGSGLTAPVAWLAARVCGARAVVYVHGLDIVAPSRLYRALWRPLLRRMDGVIANSRATAALAEGAGVSASRLSIVHPGVELPELDSGARERFRVRHGLGDVPLLLSVGRLTARKGLREFVADVLPRIVAQRPDVQLLVIGDVPKQALFAEGQTPESIREVARAAGVEEHIRFLGTVSEADLADAYQAADVFVFPVREVLGDIEGFGMVAIEAAAHGLPTVAYAVGGVTDAICDGVSGRLIPFDDHAGFVDAVLEVLDHPSDARSVRAYAEQFAWGRFGEIDL